MPVPIGHEQFATGNHRTVDMSASVVVDCDRCVVRGPVACDDCIVTALLGSAPDGVALAADERAALDVLADAGMVAPLRLVTPVTSTPSEQFD